MRSIVELGQRFWRTYRAEILGVLLCLTASSLLGWLSQGNMLWYRSLRQPFFQPPAYVFGPVWTVLYVMIGISLGHLWRLRAKKQRLFRLFVAQLVLNFLWTPLFFGAHNIGAALCDILGLWVFLAVFLWRVYADKLLFWLNVPYFLWISFASVLNGALYVLNRMNG